MGKKRKHVVSQHLEGISRSFLEKYQDVIRDYIRGRHGIYVLYKGDRLYYVGLATNLRNRLRTHLGDRHRRAWNRFSVYLTIEHNHIKELESLVLRIVKPTGNRQSGKLTGSQDLKKQLAGELRRRQREELQMLMGKRKRVTKKKTPKAKAKASQSETALGPYIDAPFWIRREYKGNLYKARVRSDGWIYYHGYLYRTPSALAKEICGRAQNGWYFWNYQRSPGDWVKLLYLKR